LIVVDASAAVELLLRTRRAERIAARVLDPTEELHAPHLIDIEVAQVLRRLVRSADLTPTRANLAIADFGDLAIERHAHGTLLRRIWALRAALSAYDGAYVALAEALAAPLVTCDGRLARAHGHTADIELIEDVL
jgi:predicted nucleic acid-binding protein